MATTTTWQGIELDLPSSTHSNLELKRLPGGRYRLLENGKPLHDRTIKGKATAENALEYVRALQELAASITRKEGAGDTTLPDTDVPVEPVNGHAAIGAPALAHRAALEVLEAEASEKPMIKRRMAYVRGDYVYVHVDHVAAKLGITPREAHKQLKAAGWKFAPYRTDVRVPGYYRMKRANGGLGAGLPVEQS